jgi:hypothetical protein
METCITPACVQQKYTNLKTDRRKDELKERWVYRTEVRVQDREVRGVNTTGQDRTGGGLQDMEM